MNYYVLQRGEQFGPFPFDHLVGMWRRGQILNDSLYAAYGWPDWVPMAECPQIAAKVRSERRQDIFLTTVVVIGLGFIGLWFYENFRERPRTPAEIHAAERRSAEQEVVLKGIREGVAFAQINYAEGARQPKTEEALSLTARSVAGASYSSDYGRGFARGYRDEWKRLTR